MILYPILDKSSDVQWAYLSDENDRQIVISDAEAVLAILEVKKQFEIIFGAEYVNSQKKLTILHHTDGAQTFRQCCLISLFRNIKCVPQMIFQFSHELCHFMIPDQICDRFRWFEETLCQLMSIFVLRMVYKNPLTEACSKSAHDRIPAYIDTIYSWNTPIDGTVKDFLRLNMPLFESDCYQYNSNRIISKHLEQTFTDYPELWRLIPHLHLIDSSRSLIENLKNLSLAVGLDPLPVDQLTDRLA